MKPGKTRLLLGLLLTVVVIAGGLFWRAGTEFTAPGNHPVGPAPEDLNATDVEFAGLRGWLVPADGPAPCIVLLHGVGSDRRGMIPRARLFKSLGYSVLLFDFEAHGESPGENITFGYREAANAQDAVAFIKAKANCTRTVALGVSMGAAATLLGPRPLPVDALVLESSYPTIEDAIRDRSVVWFGPFGKYVAPLLYLQLPLRLNIPLTAMHPIDHIGELRCPVLIMAGDEDRLTLPDETRRLFAQAPSPKSFWLEPRAGHVDLYGANETAYKRHLLRFLAAPQQQQGHPE